MRRISRKLALGGFVVSAAALGFGGLSLAQEADGSRSVLTFSLGGSAGRNLDFDIDGDDSEVALTAGLSYDFIRETRSSSLSFGVDVNRLSDGEITPRLSFGYSAQGSRSTFSTTASYVQTEVSDLSISVDDAGDVITFSGDGLRRLANFAVAYTGGVDTPVGHSLGFGISDLSYSDTDDFDDTQTVYLDLGLRLSPHAASDYTLDLFYETHDVSDDDDTSRDTLSLSTSAAYQINGRDTVTASLGYSDVETQGSSGTDDFAGATFGLGWTRADTLGSYSGAFSSGISASGRRNDVTLGREKDLANGSFAVTAGYSFADDGLDSWIGELGYTQSLLRDSFQLSMSRSILSDNDNDDVAVTQLRGSYAHDINEISSLGLSLTASVNNNENDTDSERFDASLSYSREVYRQVQLSLGLRTRYARDTSDDTARSEEVFFTLSKTFDSLR